MYSPYYEGYIVGYDGYNFYCPYYYGTAAYYDWWDGFDDGDYDYYLDSDYGW